MRVARGMPPRSHCYAVFPRRREARGRAGGDCAHSFRAVISAKAGIQWGTRGEWHSQFRAVIPAKAGIQRGARGVVRLCQNQDLQDSRDFQDFTSPYLRFLPNGNPAKTNTDERSPMKDEPVES